MSIIGKNFKVDDRVVFVKTSDSRLDGQTGIVLGKSIEGLCDFYIVLLDKLLSYTDVKAISITEACLEPSS